MIIINSIIEKKPLMANLRVNLFFWSFFLFLMIQPDFSEAQSSDGAGKYPLIPYDFHRELEIDPSTKPMNVYRSVLEVGLNSMDQIAGLSPLEKLKTEGNVGKRINALEYLGRIKDKKSLDLIHGTLKKTIHPSLRIQCINALARISDEESVRIIETVLADQDKFVEEGLKLVEEAQSQDPKKTNRVPKKEEYIEVKSAAAWALGILSRKRSIAILINSLEDKELDVKVNAAYALGELADPGEMKNKPVNSVAYHLNTLLGKFNDQNANTKFRVALAFPILELMKGAETEMKKNEEDVFLFLANSLLLEDDFSRALTIRVFGRLRDIRGLLPLEYIIVRERSSWVSKEISHSLNEIRLFNQSQK